MTLFEEDNDDPLAPCDIVPPTSRLIRLCLYKTFRFSQTRRKIAEPSLLLSLHLGADLLDKCAIRF